MAEYDVSFKVKVNGWTERVSVKVEAETQWEAKDKLGEALTELVRASAPDNTPRCQEHREVDCHVCGGVES